MKSSSSTTDGGHYRRLLIMTALSFVAMYVLMYAMVNRAGNALPNVNQGYMAGLMTASMVIIEILIMRSMYHDKRWNGLILGAAAAGGILCFAAIREQAAVTDAQFLRSMIPHHAGAILMCEEAPIGDPAIVELCRGIVSDQQAEIDLMRGLLAKRRALD